MNMTNFWIIFWLAWTLGGMLMFIITADGFFNKIINGYKAILWCLICGPLVWFSGLMVLLIFLGGWIVEDVFKSNKGLVYLLTLELDSIHFKTYEITCPN